MFLFWRYMMIVDIEDIRTLMVEIFSPATIPDDCSDSSSTGCAFCDDCGICVGGNSGNTFNQDADCAGVCFGSEV